MRDDAENVSASSVGCGQLFDDDFIKFAYDEAERQAAKIGKLLFDRTSYACNIPLLPGVNSYRLDETVFEVARVTVFDGVTRWTAKTRDLYEFDMLKPDWRSMNFSETKSVFVYDSTIEIAGNCDFSGTLNIECYRLPLQKASDADQFEISAQHHPYLIDWAKYLAYQTRDADTEQAEYAKIHEERFRAYFSGVAAAAEAAKGKQRKPDVAARSGRGATPAQLADAFFAECGDLNYRNTDGRQLDAGWARSLIEDYINEAEYEACERLNIIFDSSSSICSISTNSVTRSYLIDSKVVGIKSISFTDSALNDYEINYREKHEFAKVNPSFKALPFTENKSVFVDNYTLEIAGVPVAGTLHLEIYRTPLANASVADQFEIPEKYHASLLDWAKYKAFSNPDTDIYDEAKAAAFLARFEANFGKKRELWISESIKTSLPVLASAGSVLTPSYLLNLFIHECGGYSFRNADGFVYDAGWVRNLILGYIDEAEKEACERADLIYDTSTSVCNISVNTLSAIYSIDESVYFIKAIKFTDSLGNPFDVLVRNKNEFLKINSSYRSEAFSLSKSIFIENRTVELAGIPDVEGTLHLEVYRTPLANASVSDQFEIPNRYSSSLINWVKHRAFSNPDIDIYDEAKAAAFLVRFEESFGKRQARSIVSDEIKKSLPAIQPRTQRATTPSSVINLFIHECGGISFKNSDGFLKDAGWAESILSQYTDEAEYEACERLNIIFDTDSPICSISTNPAIKSYSIDTKIVGIKSISFTDTSLNVYDINCREKHEFLKISPLFRSLSFLENKSVFIDNYTLEIAGVPVAGTLHLEIYRTPLANASVADQFEIPDKYHAKLLDWVKYKAFSNPDIDIYDEAKASSFLARFEDSFGKKRELWISESIKTSLPVLSGAGSVLTPSYLFSTFIHECGGYSFKNSDGFVYDAGWVRNLILGYIDEAEKEACERADLIYDVSTQSVCNISVDTSNSIYSIDESVYFIKEIKFTDSIGNSFYILVRNKNEFIKINSSYRTEGFSVNKSVFIENRTIELAGISDIVGTIHLEVYRTPLANASVSDQFEIPSRYSSSLINWVKYKAFSNPDIDIYDEAKAAAFLARFEDSFGKRQARSIVSDEIKKSLPAIQLRTQRAIIPSAAINLFIHECGGINFKNSDGFLKDAGWAESVLAGYLDEAEYEACERSNILFDKDTPAVCQIPVVAGQSVYSLHGSVAGISYIKFVPAVGSQFDVLVREKVEFSQISPAWRAAGFSANKSVFVHDSELEIAGIPDVAGTLHLEVYRSPLANASVADQFEIPEKYHAKLLDWVKYRAFSNPDIDIYDVKKSYVFYGQFQRAFGKRRDRKYIADEIKTALPVSVNMSGALSPLDLCNMFRLDAREKAFKNADGTLYDAGWRTDLLLSYADEAEREAAARASLIFDSETESICKIAVASGQSKYQLSELVVRVCKCSFIRSDGSVSDLEVRYSESEDIVSNGNRNKDFLENRVVYIREGELSCQGNVSIAGDILLEVYRYPKVPASSVGSFEITSRHHINLLHYIKYKAYSSVDNDVFHESAAYHERKFIDIYGSKKTESLVNRESIRYLRTNKRWY